MRIENFSQCDVVQNLNATAIKQAKAIESMGAIHIIDNYLCVATPEMDIYSQRIFDDSNTGLTGAILLLYISLRDKIKSKK
jgi:hypothetical protein